MSKKSSDSLDERCTRFWQVVDGVRSVTRSPHSDTRDVRLTEEEYDDGYDSDDELNKYNPDEEFWDRFDMDEAPATDEPK